MNLHHAGVLVKDIAATRAFYLRMGYKQASEVIHDPLQTACVQFLGLPDDPVYLELVSPDGPGSKLNNALEKGFGGVHHLCYSTNDIHAASDSLRLKGFMLISPPTPAVAFHGRSVAWLRGPDRFLMELVERGGLGEY
jgi:methylmalonyl-CoA/ethylmalonyl-CoA epimerase